MATYEWTFGDGASALGRIQTHIYWLPGTYKWICTITDNNYGAPWFFTGTIYVYDWDYGEGGLNVSYTDRCLRYSMKPSKGFGWARFGGDDWPFPEARVGTLKILDSVDRERLLVLDAKTCKIHEIAVRDLFRDGETDYAGTEIETAIEFKEERGSAENYFIRSLEHHAEFRPYDENNQGADGYTAAGYRNAFSVDFVLRKDGTQETDTLKAENVPIEGDITFKYDDNAHRWQPVIRTTTSEYRLVKLRNYYERLDKAASPNNRTMSEQTYGLELMASSMNLDRQADAVGYLAQSNAYDELVNFATGNDFTGNYFGFAQGPDGKSSSAISFIDINTGVQTAESVLLSGDLTLMIWAKECFDADLMAQNGGFTLDIDENNLTYSETGGDNTSLPVNWNLDDWHLYTIIRTGTILRMYVDKTLKRSIDWTPRSQSGVINCMNLSAGQIYVARVYPAAISVDALRFHYDDVTMKAGKATCKVF